MKKKGLMIVGHSYVVKEYQQALSHLLESGEYNVLLITPEEYKEGGRPTKADVLLKDIKHVPMKTFFGKLGKQHLHWYYNVFKIIYYIMTMRPDVFYLYEEPNSTVTFQFVILTKIFSPNTKILLWSSNDSFRDYSKVFRIYDIRRYLFPFNMMMNFALSDAILATSEDTCDVLRKKGFKKRLFLTTTHGIDPEKLCPLEKHNTGILKVGFIGRLENQKGLHVLLDAVRIIREQKTVSKNFGLSIYGDGKKRDEYVKFVNQNGFGDIVEWHGFYSYNELNNIMNSFDILVVPSITEGSVKEKFGRVIIEGMACGLPVLISRSGGMPKVGGDVAIIFTEGSSDELADELAKVINNPERILELGKAGRKRVLDKYSYGHVGKKLGIIFQKLVTEKNGFITSEIE